jgi:hypothetical protein
LDIVNRDELYRRRSGGGAPVAAQIHARVARLAAMSFMGLNFERIAFARNIQAGQQVGRNAYV